MTGELLPVDADAELELRLALRALIQTVGRVAAEHPSVALDRVIMEELGGQLREMAAAGVELPPLARMLVGV